MKKVCSFVLMLALLLAAAGCAPAASSTETLVFLTVEGTGDGCFYGSDFNGDLWCVHGGYDAQWSGTWVRFDGEPQAAEGLSYGGKTVRYEVSEAETWLYVSDSRYSTVYDTASYDIDGDGVEEECVISLKGAQDTMIFQLSVWENGECTVAADFYGYTSLDALAFCEEDGALKIRLVNWPYGADTWEMDTYNISCGEGRITVSSANG